MNPANQAFLEGVFRAAVAAVEPGKRVREHLARDGRGVVLLSGARPLARLEGRVWVVAAGKAASGMAQAAAGVLADRLAGGVAVGPEPIRGLPASVETFTGGHPLPGPGSLAAGRAVWQLLGRARRGETVLVLLSGGASSLLVLPAAGLSLRDKTVTTRLLLRAGAGIAEINAVRKHLSRLKGGGLARRAGEARVLALLVSDVIGNAPSVIGSGPAASDPTTFADAWRILRRYELLDRVPPAVRRHLDAGRKGRVRETPKAGEIRTRHVRIADVRLALEAAAREARGRGVAARIVTSGLRGDTRRAARRFALEARRLSTRGRPLCLLAGGETTVEVRGAGKGGRNQEFALVFAQAIDGGPPVACLSAGSDGIDGPTDAAGAFVDSATLSRARRRGLDADRYLERNDSYRFFDALEDLFYPGRTGTNVMDLKIVLLGDRPPATRGRR